MFPTCVIFMREVASLSVMFPTGVPLRDGGGNTGECIQKQVMFESLPESRKSRNG